MNIYGSAKSSSGSTPSESSASSMAEESSSVFSSMAESLGSSAIEESSSGANPYGESSAASSSSAVSSESDSGSIGSGDSGDSGGSSTGDYCSFDVYDTNTPASNVGEFSVYNSGTVPLTLHILSVFSSEPIEDSNFVAGTVLAPGEVVTIFVTLAVTESASGVDAILDTSCGSASFTFP